MSYTQLPVRTGADTNSAADANQLQANIEALKGGSGGANVGIGGNGGGYDIPNGGTGYQTSGGDGSFSADIYIYL